MYIAVWKPGFRPAALLVLAFGVSCCAETLQVDLAPEALLKTRLESGAVSMKQRETAIEQLFLEAGCRAGEQPISKHAGDVVCTLPGETGSTIVVGGHFDFVERGKGIVDDWSGASLLPTLYQSLKNLPRHHTYVFVAFADEERGLVGSSKFVKSMSADEKAHITAFINLECLGLSPPKVWTNRSAKTLVLRLSEVSHAINIDLLGANVDLIGDDDTHPFFSARIPVISIHSLTQGTLNVLHSRRDRVSAIDLGDYYSAYKLVAYYLAYLDVKEQ